MKTNALRAVVIILMISSGFFLPPFSAPVYASDIFKKLTIENGLAHTDASCVIQDSTGLIWIGTNSGLQNFDGYQFQTIDYYHPGQQRIYQSHNRINALACGKKKLWIGSDSGLTCLDLDAHRYIPYTLIGNDQSISTERIVGLAIDILHNRLWIRTVSRLYAARVDEAAGRLYLLDWESEYDREFPWINFEPVIHKGNAWVFTRAYLVKLGVESDKVKILNTYSLTGSLRRWKTPFHAIAATADHLYLRSDEGCCRIPFTGDEPDLSGSVSIDFHAIDSSVPFRTRGPFVVGKEETLWCGYFGGLFEVRHPFTDRSVITAYPGNDKNIEFSQARIRSLFIDGFDNLWVSMTNRGILYRPLSTPPFSRVPSSEFRKAGFSEKEISAVVAQADTALWMIVEGSNLLRYDLKTERLRIVPLPVVRQAVDGLQTLALSADRQTLYIGLVQGIVVYEIRTGKSYWLTGDRSELLSHIHASIVKLAEDAWGRLWLCSWGKGVYCIENPLSEPVVAYHLTARSWQALVSDFTLDFYVEDRALLVCTDRGLNRIRLEEDGAIRDVAAYRVDPNSVYTLSSDYIACIDRQDDSTYWLGTIGGGLNKLVIRSPLDNDYSATVYTRENGLTSNDCEIVCVDREQHVWIGGNGITRLDPRTGKVAVYDRADGLQSNSFKIGAGYKTDDGTIYMGSIDGLNYFSPDDFTEVSCSTDLRFCQLYVNNRLVRPRTDHDGRIPLLSELNRTRLLSLTYDQNNFAVTFSALGYNLSNRIMYRYRLAGYDKHWQVIPYTVNKAYYANLPYGNYRFEVQVSVDRGFTWVQPGKQFALSMLPPWWLTGWAKSLYVFAFLSVTVLIVYQYNKAQRLKREKHRQELQRIGDEEKYQSKMRFFMNVSHELKTPLTLIMLAAERLKELHLSKECTAILANSRKMLSLVTELVDIRKADLGINRLSSSYRNLSELVGRLHAEMNLWAEKKNIRLEYRAETTELIMELDWEKIGKLVVNLLSNAIKYTAPGGFVRLILKRGIPEDIAPLYAAVHREGEIVPGSPIAILYVQDSGAGIAPESLDHIYDRFFQEKETGLSCQGSGIGLAIAKNMVLLHRGCIWVSSERNTGTEFIVALPAPERQESREDDPGDAFFSVEEFVSNQYPEYSVCGADDDLQSAEQAPETLRPVLLLVEDNPALRRALQERLSVRYDVRTAGNGREGLELCESIYPDLIVSDVMMPEMDGLEMCRRIRDNLSVAYIPLILLTARGDVENQIEGYECGADLYVPKPFSFRFLEVNLKRLLVRKEKWFKQQQAPAGHTEEPEDETGRFEVRLRSLVEKHMGDPEFSVGFLCEELCLGRTKLYSKMKEIGDQPLADYIRNIRMEKSVYLLEHSVLNINEIMSEVGFVNSSHFSKIFKQKFGVSPSDYRKRHVDRE